MYDGSGRDLGVIYRDEVEAGEQEVNVDVRGLSSGLYICEVRAGDAPARQLLLVIK